MYDVSMEPVSRTEQTHVLSIWTLPAPHRLPVLLSCCRAAKSDRFPPPENRDVSPGACGHLMSLFPFFSPVNLLIDGDHVAASGSIILQALIIISSSLISLDGHELHTITHVKSNSLQAASFFFKNLN